MPENDFLVLKVGSGYLSMSKVRIPNDPSSLSAAAVSTVQINLSWTDNSKNETGFKVERSPNGSTGWTQIGTTLANVAAYSDATLLPGTQYFYRVRAYNSAGNSGYTNTANATTASGTGYYVDTGGNDANNGLSLGAPFKTLNHGASVLLPGDTLYIRGGTYNETLQDAIPSGTSWSVPVTLMAYNGEAVTIKPPAASGWVLHFQASHYIQVLGCFLDATNVVHDAVKITDDGVSVAQHIRLQDCEVANIPATPTGAASIGILVTTNHAAALYANSNEFIRVKLHDVGGVGGAGNDQEGFYIQSNSNLLDGCEVYGCSSFGLQIYHQTSTLDGTDCSNNIVRNCKFHGNAVATASGSGEVLIGMGQNNLFHDNLVYGGIGGVLVKYAADGTKVYNNTIVNNTNVNYGGLRLAAAAAGFGVPTNTRVFNNILFNNKNDFTDLGTGTVTNYNAAGTAPAGLAGAHDLKNVNPVFVKGWVSPPQLQLRSFSPLLLAGQTLADAPVDFAGTARAVGGACNLGAYEGSVVVPGATYYLDTAGSDSAAGSLAAPWATFTFALGNIYPGDILYVNSGTYDQRIDGNQNPNTGSSWNPGGYVLIAGTSGGASPVLQSTFSGLSAGVNLFKGKYIELRDLVIDGTHRVQGTVNIKIQSDNVNGTVASYIRLRRVRSTNGQDAGIYITDDNTVTPNLHADHCELLGVTVDNCGQNPVSGNNDTGIVIESNDNVIGRDPLSGQNTLVHDIAGFGIKVSKTTTTSGAGLDASRNSISDFKVYTVGTAGVDGACVHVANGDGNSVFNGICYDGVNGIRVTGTSDGLHNATNTKVYNNTVDACTRTGTGAPSGVDGIRIGFATSTDVKDNIASNSLTSDYVNTGTGTTSDYNLTKDATAVGAHSLHADPVYVNAGTHDYHIQTTSPAKNAGTSTAPTVTDDYDAVARPHGTAYCIGALEF